MRICFDLDGTLCTGTRMTPGGTNYDNCSPMPGASSILRELRRQGHTVILQTARGMGSTGGNVGAAVAKVATQTVAQLNTWGFEYDELHFGKPSADLYVDDKAQNALEFWNQQLELEEKLWQ